MPLFFIIYGMVVNCKNLHTSKEWKLFLLKEVKALVVPYVIWACIYSNGFGIKFFLGVGYGSNPSLGYANTNAVLWFLPAMFVATIFYQVTLSFIEKYRKKITVLIGIFLLFMIISKICGYVGGIRFPWGIDIAFMGTTFMLLGRFIGRPGIEFVFAGKNKSVLVGALLLAVSVIIAIVNKPITGDYPATVMALAEYGKSIILFAVGAAAATGFILIVCNFIRGKLVSYLGQHSLLMMAVHYILFPYTLFIAKYIFQSNPQLTILIAITNALFVTVICVPINCLADKFCVCLNGK